MKKLSWQLPFGLAGLLAALPAFADEVAAPKIDTGDTSWMLISTALVLLMTPGLAFFYGGMARTRHVVSTLLQNYAALGVVSLVWLICGYSLAFSGNISGFIGDFNFLMLNGVGQNPHPDLSPTVPHSVFMLFQCMFAVITPALISGALAERIKFTGWLAFLAVWSLIVYSPVCHWVWGVGGWLRTMGALDFAGGAVVHMTAGYSAIVAAWLLGKRRDYGAECKPYDLGYVLLGAGLLFFGWFGFNAGSAIGANGLAAQAFGNTFFAGCAAMMSWMLYDHLVKGKISAIGAACGVVVGLVAITPASGFVTFGSAVIIGLSAGLICNIAVGFVKKLGLFDDTLDVFACHGVGGTLGMLMTALFATKTVNPAGGDGLFYGNPQLLVTHLIAAIAVIAISVIGTFIAVKVAQLFVGYRVTDHEEKEGLDYSQHGEFVNSNFSPSVPLSDNPHQGSHRKVS